MQFDAQCRLFRKQQLSRPQQHINLMSFHVNLDDVGRRRKFLSINSSIDMVLMMPRFSARELTFAWPSGRFHDRRVVKAARKLHHLVRQSHREIEYLDLRGWIQFEAFFKFRP